MIREDREMMRLAKKRSEIGGQRVDEFLPFEPITTLKQRQILAKSFLARLAQATRQAAIHHILLGRRERNAGVVVDQLAHTLEISRRKHELAIARRLLRRRKTENRLLFTHLAHSLR